MKDKIIIPYAPVLVESTRSIGYSFETAVADIIDNSISAGATDIRVCFMSKDPQWLCIEDNGCGMSESELETAMRYGSHSPSDVRSKDDLGRFGLGLKTASLSQCRKVTVMSKRDGQIVAACWDLDYIIQTGEWSLQLWSGEEIKNLPGHLFLETNESGTVVLWQKFDRLQQESVNVQQTFDEKIELTRKHIALVFHRFLNTEGVGNRISITFNGDPVTGADPFLTRHPATQPMTEQLLRVNGEEIRVKPYILPFASKLSAKDIRSIGGTDDLRQQQGFYIYRNRRLIIWGTWFRLIRQNELGKLARVRVDIPNSLDSIWKIDIKKSTAALPSFIKKNLADIVRNAVGRSERVYRYRGRNIQTDALTHIWEPFDQRGVFRYRINRDVPIYKMLEDHMDEGGLSLLDAFSRMLEDSFPYADVYYHLAKNESDITGHTMEFDAAYEIADQMVQQIISGGGDLPQFLRTMDQVDFFVKYPEVVSKIREVYADD